MSLVATLSVFDLLFLLSTGLLLVASVAYRRDHTDVARPLAVNGWFWLGVFWSFQVRIYYPKAAFLVFVHVATVALCWYAALLAATNRGPITRLTLAFAIMGAVFVPFGFLVPIHRAVLEITTRTTAIALIPLGINPIISTVSGGYRTLLLFPDHGGAWARITPACTGISGIAMFAGLVMATWAPLSKRVVGALAAGAFLYFMNIARTTFVAGATAGQWFGGLAPFVGPVVSSTEPASLSFAVAEYVVTKIAVVLVLAATYVALSRWIPELDDFVSEVFDVAIEDFGRLQTLLREE